MPKSTQPFVYKIIVYVEFTNCEIGRVFVNHYFLVLWSKLVVPSKLCTPNRSLNIFIAPSRYIFEVSYVKIVMCAINYQGRNQEGGGPGARGAWGSAPNTGAA